MKGVIMMEEKQITEPLLYIDQPVIQRPSAAMQEQYSSKIPVILNEKVNQDNKKKKEEVAFKYLSITEKVNYLVDLPREVPSIRCEILTNRKKYRGIIKKREDEIIILRINGRESQKINIVDIKSIRLIGF